MRARILFALAVLCATLCASAPGMAQCTGIFGANTACGSVAGGLPRAVDANTLLANKSTTVNGIVCTLGSTCSVTATANSVTVGTTTVLSGATNRLLFDNSGTLGEIATANNGILVTSAAGVPSISSTIPNAVQTSIATTGTLLSGATGAGFTLNFGASTLSGQVPVANGGTGLSTLSSNVIYKGNGAGNIAASTLIDTGVVVFTGEPIDLASQSLGQEIANASVTGTSLNKLAKLTGAPSTAVIITTTATSGAVGVVVGGNGTTGSALVAVSGQASCVFDGPTTAGDYVQISGTVNGDCHDSGATYPSSGQVVGRVLSTNGGGGTYAMIVFGPEIVASSGGGGGGVPSVTITNGNGITQSGTCNSSGAINCTVNAPGTNIIGQTRNLKIVQASGATLTVTADEIVTGTALSGTTYREASVSHTFTITSVGANGMDSALSTAGYVCIYSITKGDGATYAVLGQNSSANNCPTIYGGLNMPAGYVASSLIGIWPNTAPAGTPAVIAGTIVDRQFYYTNASCAMIKSNVTGNATLTSTSASAGIPQGARFGSFLAGESALHGNNQIFAADSSYTGFQQSSSASSMAIFGSATICGVSGIYINSPGPLRVPILTSQTIFWMETGLNAAQYMWANGYEW